jgi:uncharacterized coiled-coil protein SlyX
MASNDFFKFWAEFFRQTVAGQQRVTNMAEWIQAGCPPNNVLADLLRSCYGLSAAQTSGGDLWQKTVTEFLSTLNAYAPLWGWIPLARYDRLKRKTERLERKIAAQERTIQQLDALLNEKGLGHTALMTRFQNLINDQTQAFDELMQTITEINVADESKPRQS